MLSPVEVMSRLLQLPADPDQNDRAKRRHDDLRDQSARRIKSHRPEHESANDPARNPQQAIDHDAIPSAAHDPTGGPARNQAHDDDPKKPNHDDLPKT